jgi:hypothetical protein
MVHYVMASVPMTVIAASAWYGVSRNGEVTTVSFAWWTPLLALLVGIAVAAYGFRLYQKRSHYYRYGPVLMVLGPVLIILTIPMLLLNKTVVDNQRFAFADGMWWNIHRYEVRFDDVRSARLETQEKQTRNTTYLERRLVLEMKDGVAQTVVVRNTLVAAWPDLVRHFQSRGIKGLPETLPE